MDWSVYDLVDKFTLHDAGFLLCELDPLPFCYKLPDNDPYLRERQKAKIFTDALIADAKQGRLKVQNSEGKDAFQIWKERDSKPTGRGFTILPKGYFPHWLVHRDDLRAWAESKNKKPPFLFPESKANADLHHAQSGHTKGIAHMVTPQKWNTLDQAAAWLSGKTNEKWTIEGIIDFSISQCKPDDIVEDYKYPSYLRSIIPAKISKLLTWVALRGDVSLERSYVYDSFKFGDKEIVTTFLFKENLQEIQVNGKSELLYVKYGEPAMSSDLRPINVYCELRPLVWCLDDPLEFPTLPAIEINYQTIGISEKGLKQLLRDYLALPNQPQSRLLPGEQQTQQAKKLLPNQQDKIDFQEIAAQLWEENPDATIAEVTNSEKSKAYKRKYKDKTLAGWARKIDPRQGEKRGRPKKNKLKIPVCIEKMSVNK